MLFFLPYQYHASWCSGDFRSQDISRQGIDSETRNIPSPAPEVLIIPINDSYCYVEWHLHVKQKHVQFISPWCWIYASVNLMCIGQGNGLSPVRRQAITWTNADLLLTGPSGTNFSEIQIEIQNFSCMKMHWKMSSAKWRPFCPERYELIWLKWAPG